MDGILQTTALRSTQTTAAKAQGDGAPSDYDTFLRMLTTQMQNQDPLNPIDSADYAVQLATFSSVEQQTRTNQLLDQLMTKFDLLGMSELAGWVGNEARADVPVAFDGRPVTISPEPDAKADRAVLVVRDAGGAVMARDEVALPAEDFDWAGQDATGTPLPAGTYALTLESYAEGNLLSTTAVESYARIDEVRSGRDGTVLRLSGGAEVPAASVTALRVAP